jgi:hypothetical protein
MPMALRTKRHDSKLDDNGPHCLRADGKAIAPSDYAKIRRSAAPPCRASGMALAQRFEDSENVSARTW